ncbi:sodium calcium exchanger protein [Colletotrichum truncatum]|uniref:Sodium calcium exchanger protein n=1 Tax=Colletotrichum truncatum TaxID=5467 RepID=A0ACC3Z4P4_COLTU|nr:sodium calcium exchanger protein [Colletotrichum truncatum]KAF6788619.1 sodium calcium exchanger protein [Colletotrichum truncatum]
MPTTSKVRGSGLRLRPFYTTVFLLTLLATWSYFSKATERRFMLQDASSPLLKRNELTECRDVHRADDQCAFVKAHCAEDEAGLLSYLTLYYCDLNKTQAFAFVILVCWLGLLFTTIGIAASDFFSVNLNTISTILGLSESLAGVTFLAFGNGSPDVFSTFAAMGSNSASMAVGELIGAASFITAVVAGSMALVREFKVGRKTYVRDLCFFIVAVCFTMVFLADGHLHLWECITMVCYYIFYVVTVVTWHWYSTRRSQRRVREAAARGHVYGAVGHPNDELAPEPYRDDPDDEDRQVTSTSASNAGDISTLEAGPRIEVDDHEDGEDEAEETEHGRHVVAEMASSMRVLRPRGRRRNTLTPIRPSLVGALEFRSALAQLQRESNLRLRPMHGRAYSVNNIGAHGETATTVGPPSDSGRYTISAIEGLGQNRNRAMSSGDVPGSLATSRDHSPWRFPPQGTSANPVQQVKAQDARNRSPSPAYKIGGNLAPPPVEPVPLQLDPAASESLESRHFPGQLSLQIPSRRTSFSDRSSPVSPFPGYTDSPMVLTPAPQNEPTEFIMPPGPARMEVPFAPYEINDPKPVRWWPYAILPPPHIFWSTLFPTLLGWQQKSYWDRFVSTISVPSILLLVLTLPVVESESPDESPDDTIVDSLAQGPNGRANASLTLPEGEPIEQESEWQRFRRSTLTHSRIPSVEHSPKGSPALIAVDDPSGARVATEAPTSHPQTVKPAAPLPSESSLAAVDDSGQWNRWLVAIQLFTGPLFAVVILWANMMEDFQQPYKVLVRFILYTLLASTILLGLLLMTTNPDKRPKFHFLLCFMGFIIAIAWISTIAGEVVGVLKAFGVILGISDALLGLTIFAAGNSVGDLIADITVARLGYPVMALSACFGGPMLNILLGIGIGGVYMMVQAANHRHKKHPDKPFKYHPYQIQIGGTLMISAITLLLTLLGLLIIVPMNKWVMSRKIGWGLIAIWTISTMVNVIVEMTGVWTDVSYSIAF